MEHVQAEIRRLETRLFGQPDPFHHAGLYAARQALVWALHPEAFASPLATVLGTSEGSGDCSGDSYPPPSQCSSGVTLDAVERPL